MKEGIKKIWLPLCLIGVAALQSFGIDVSRNFPHTRNLADSIITAKVDTIDSIDSLKTKQTVELKDTIKVPDSLKVTDPFKYKYFVALRDSVVRMALIDSLLLAKDSLELHKFDSLYFKDSSEVAKIKFDAWYASLTKKEKKKFDYEQALPKKIHEMDSILHRKDSIKAYKDSVRLSIPRVLSTFALPDSLQYKRIVTWNNDRRFQDLKILDFDTTYNYHYNDYPFMKKDVDVTYLGVVGSPVETFDWFKRDEDQEENAIFYTPYRCYNYSPSTLPMYNTKTPYTELAYWGTLFANREKEESNIKLLTTQNILPELNLTLEYHRYGGNGLLRREDTDNRTGVIAANYLGKKYMMHTGYIYNGVERSENGGMIDNYWIRDTTVDSREIEVNLKKASNKIKKHSLFLDQSLRIPLGKQKGKLSKKEIKLRAALKDSIMASGDSVAIADFLQKEKIEADSLAKIKANTLVKDMTSAFIGHNSEFTIFSKYYTDEISPSDEIGRKFYNNKFYLHPTRSADSLRVMKFDNKFFIRLQPWKNDAILSKIDVGIGDKVAWYYNFKPDGYLKKSRNTLLNSAYIYAGVRGQFKKYLKWDAYGDYTFVGYEANDFGVEANLIGSLYPFRRNKKSPLVLEAHFKTKLKEPDWYQQHLLTNHFRWNNKFKKISTTKIQADLKIPHWRLYASFGYALLDNHIYYDTEAIVRQNKTPMSVMTASLQKDFTAWKFHFDHKLLFQYSSNKEILPLPMLSLNFRYYFQFDVVKNVMQMQIGANGLYNTKWNAPSYNPVLGVFYNQNEHKYGNCAYLDLFVNIQWKRACIFVKVQNVNMGWPNKSADYFSANHYIKPQRTVKFGIFWPFYVQTGKNSKVGGGASSESGNSPGSGFGGGLDSDLGGFNSGMGGKNMMGSPIRR